MFKTVENAFALNISGNFDNEIWSVAETETGYEVQARRYGHGVGMSQWGAEVMAQNGSNYKEILYHYYPPILQYRSLSCFEKTFFEEE